ncbi:MAG: histidinol-phosphatase HisJ family protein [Eubacteriales bacterium]|nr:histidinol-phosphatase HisJ family protein [Eubacteriales bacterium]
MFADYHLHSEFSDDSITPMEQQIEQAIAMGIEEICFTEHVDYGIKKDWTEENLLPRIADAAADPESVRSLLTNANYPEYFGKLLRMKKIYGEQITIRNGLEYGVQQHTIPQFEALVKKYDHELDFVLLSIHQVGNEEFWTGDYFKGRTQMEYNMGYYTEMLEVISRFPYFDVLAHVDSIARYDPCGPIAFSRIQDILTDIFQLVIKQGKGIELNTSSWHYKLSDTTPSKDILKLYRSLGGEIITVGSDAHTPVYVGDHIREACSCLKELGFTHIYTYEKHQPIPHEI